MDYYLDINNFDFTLIRGVSEVIRFWDWKKLEADGSIGNWNLIEKEIRVQFKEDIGDNHFALELNTVNGGLTVQATVLDLNFGLNTLNLCKDVYYYDVLLIDGDKRITTVRGKMILTGIITK